MSEPPSTLAVFRNPAFRNLWFATLASNFGGIVQAVGAAWLMTSLTSSASMVALVQSSVTLPIMIFSLTAGVFADNFDRRKIMLWAQAFMCVASVGLAFLAYEGLLSNKQEAQTNAIEFLDNLLTGDLKRTLLPIIEDTALDFSSEEVVQKIKHKVPTEMDCFKLLLDGNDLKVKLAVLYLIKHQRDEKYAPMVQEYSKSDDIKVRTFAKEALEELRAPI